MIHTFALIKNKFKKNATLKIIVTYYTWMCVFQKIANQKLEDLLKMIKKRIGLFPMPSKLIFEIRKVNQLFIVSFVSLNFN